MAYIKKLVMQGFKSFPRKTEVPFTSGINVILGPNGSGKSARYDTQVLTKSDGIMKIGDIVEESLKKSKDIKKLDDGVYSTENALGLEIFSLNQKSMKIEPKKVIAFMKRDGEKNLYTIHTKTGKKVTTTECHPVMIYKQGKIVSEVVKNLKRGSFIAAPNKLELNEEEFKVNLPWIKDGKISNEFSRFIGYIVGDGCIIKDKRVDFVNMDEEIIKDYTSILKNLGFMPKVSYRKNNLAKTIYFNSRSTANSLIKLFNNEYKKEGKHIPSEILFSKKEFLANFLAALFDCDSSIRRDNPTFEYVTMSERLAEEVVLSLLRFNIVARKVTKKKYATNTEKKIKRDYYHIMVEGKDKLSLLMESINLRCIHKETNVGKMGK